MKKIIIAAVSTDGIIGIGENMPWRIPEDFKHYREVTMGNVLVVGATTFKTLPPKAHEGREFIILSNSEFSDLKGPQYSQVRKLDILLELLDNGENDFDEVYVIGGASIYNALIDHCDEAIITWVDKTYPEGDKKFPIDNLFANFEAYAEMEWQTSKTGLRYKITRYQRIEKQWMTIN